MSSFGPAFGNRAEDLIVERFSLTQEDTWYYDAVDSDGCLLEIKACRTLHTDDRSGRWVIYQDSHEELVHQDGYYALLVYPSDSDVDVPKDEFVEHLAILPASWVDSLIPHWNDTNHPKCSKQYKLGWPKIFGAGGDG